MLIPFRPVMESRPLGWSFGYCPSCQQGGVLWLEELTDVHFDSETFPGSRRRTARCDFCGRRVARFGAPYVPLGAWSPLDGLPALLRQLGFVLPEESASQSPDVRLHSLLSAVEEATGARRQRLTEAGILPGLFAGALIGGLAAFGLHESGSVVPPPPLDAFGFIGGVACLSGVCGILVGGTLHYLRGRDRSAVERIEAAYVKYGIDLDRLEELSRQYSKRIRRAVQVVCARSA